jgi:hypothetical protein
MSGMFFVDTRVRHVATTLKRVDDVNSESAEPSQDGIERISYALIEAGTLDPTFDGDGRFV